jgi:glycosyltransferase involved in cell wall biosynthesis
MDQTIVQDQARRNNSVDIWDKLWQTAGEVEWRAEALKRVYARIAELIPPGAAVTDVGGGAGSLAEKLIQERQAKVTVIDHSASALKQAELRGAKTLNANLAGGVPADHTVPFFVCTEVLEHFDYPGRGALLYSMWYQGQSALISVPNNRLGPDEEPQHAIKFTAMSFKRALEQCWGKAVRVEVMGPYLLGVCGNIAHKPFRLSVTLPVRDEARDLGPVLASFRGVADELIVGVDPRTKDGTWEAAAEYADVVFSLQSPEGPPTGHTQTMCEACSAAGGQSVAVCKQYMGANGVNFAWARNQCIARCTGDWIFMTEGHERLVAGQDFLLQLEAVLPKEARVGFVLREGNGQQWAFPWLFRNSSDIRFRRPVHNMLDFPEGTFAVMLPQVRTFHERHAARGAERAVQRRSQNRRQLMDDWQTEKNINSLFYLGQEWRDMDPQRAIERLDQFLATSNNGVQKYQARLILAKECINQGETERARQYLLGCTGDDWSRTEHWIWLGDLAFNAGEFEKAYRFYTYASTTIGMPPFTVWWIDLCYYSYTPAQRLAMVCGEVGALQESLHWAKVVIEQLPPDAPDAVFEEAKSNISILEEAINARQ